MDYNIFISEKVSYICFFTTFKTVSAFVYLKKKCINYCVAVANVFFFPLCTEFIGVTG